MTSDYSVGITVCIHFNKVSPESQMYNETLVMSPKFQNKYELKPILSQSSVNILSNNDCNMAKKFPVWVGKMRLLVYINVIFPVSLTGYLLSIHKIEQYFLDLKIQNNGPIWLCMDQHHPSRHSKVPTYRHS